MGNIILRKNGGGIASDDVTAKRENVLIGTTALTNDSDDEIVEGTMPNNAAVSQMLPINGLYTIPQGFHNGNGFVYQNFPTNNGGRYVPTNRDVVLARAGELLENDIIIAGGGSNFISSNIRNGITIFGTSGSFKEPINLPSLNSSTIVCNAGGSVGPVVSYDSTKCSISGTTIANYVGTYTIRASIMDTSYYVFENGNSTYDMTWYATYHFVPQSWGTTSSRTSTISKNGNGVYLEAYGGFSSNTSSNRVFANMRIEGIQPGKSVTINYRVPSYPDYTDVNVMVDGAGTGRLAGSGSKTVTAGSSYLSIECSHGSSSTYSNKAYIDSIIVDGVNILAQWGG